MAQPPPVQRKSETNDENLVVTIEHVISQQPVAGQPAWPRSLEGMALQYRGTSSDGSLSCMTDSGELATDGLALLERKADMEKAGLVGAKPCAIWVGNVPESYNSESAVRMLFSEYGDIRRGARSALSPRLSHARAPRSTPAALLRSHTSRYFPPQCLFGRSRPRAAPGRSSHTAPPRPSPPPCVSRYDSLFNPPFPLPVTFR